jgi:DNA-binding LytR/AlgR family response regulator
MSANKPTCIIADDEPLLAAALRKELSALWPELEVIKVVSNGPAALAAIQEHNPVIAFLDIQMPGMTGIDVAKSIADDESGEQPSAPRVNTAIVFVTAFDEYATQAFDMAAIDYVLKPINSDRLAKCVARLKKQLSEAAPSSDVLLAQLQKLMSVSKPSTTTNSYLRHIKASIGDSVKLIPINEVVYFQAADKYVIVMTAQGESLIREALKDIIEQLDPQHFVQIHRGTVVNIDSVQEMQKDELGRHVLVLKGVKQRPVVSRLYTHVFKAM